MLPTVRASVVRVHRGCLSEWARSTSVGIRATFQAGHLASADYRLVCTHRRKIRGRNDPVVRRTQFPPYQRLQRLRAATCSVSANQPAHGRNWKESAEPKRDSSGDSKAVTSVGLHRAPFAPWQAQERPLRILRWLLLIKGRVCTTRSRRSIRRAISASELQRRAPPLGVGARSRTTLRGLRDPLIFLIDND
jgi:hypothetical protein